MGYFIAAVSNEGGAPEQTYRKMQSAGACDDKPLSEMFKFEVPSLMVGTLDSLMVSVCVCQNHHLMLSLLYLGCIWIINIRYILL